MYASTAGGGAMSLVFKPRKTLKKGTVTSIKMPDSKKTLVRQGEKSAGEPPHETL